MAIVLYPGAFKPPHRGHFELVKSLLKGNHGGVIYDIDTAQDALGRVIKGERDKIEPIDKVIIFLGGGERNGITKEESKTVWDIYNKYLSNVEIIVGQINPMFAAKDYAKEHPDQKFYAVTGVRGEEDAVDLRRITAFKNRPNVNGLVVPAQGNQIRATDFRKTILTGSLDAVIDFFPKELSREEILHIMKLLKQSIIAEMMLEDIGNVMDNLFEVEEGSSGTAIAPKGTMRSLDRTNLQDTYTKLRNLLGDEEFHVTYNTDHIEVRVKQEGDAPGFDYTSYMASILEHMIDQGMKIIPLPEIKVKKDLVEASDFFGRTAYYNTTLKEIVLFTEGRHPKDVMRSFAHEMIHHMQNLEGRLVEFNTTNTNEDDTLLELEKEAYLKGNITFRNWEDKIKNKNK